MKHAAVSSLHFMLGKNFKLLLWQKQKKNNKQVSKVNNKKKNHLI